MKKDEIQNFVWDVTRNDVMLIAAVFIYPNNRFDQEDIVAESETFAIEETKEKIGCCIYLNKGRIYEFGPNTVKAIVLHELGHFFTSKGKPSTRNEYSAWKWAIQRAKELKMKNVVLAAQNFISSHSDCSWNRSRMYRMVEQWMREDKLI